MYRTSEPHSSHTATTHRPHHTATARPDRAPTTHHPDRRLGSRWVGLAIAFVLAAATLFVPTPADAQGTAVRDAGMESGFLASLNQQRAARGIGPLTLNGSMSAAAAGWTQQMVSGEFLAHASDIVSGTPAGWTKVGENVGRGQSVASLTQSFLNSPSHARNVLDPAFTHVGIGVYVHPTGRVYTTHRFAALGAPAPQPTPVPIQPTPVPPTPCLLYTSPSPRDATLSRMPSSA